MKPPKKIVVELMAVGNKSVLQRAVFALPYPNRMTGHGIDLILKQYSDDVVARFPGMDYRIVTLKGHRYRFVHIPKTLEQLAAQIPA